MDEKEFCKEIMGIIDPWEISRIKTDKEQKRVDVYLEYPEIERGKCPVCGKQAPVYDRRERRVWRHLDSCEYKTYLHCRLPRTKCLTDGIKTMDIPWALEQSHFTLSFERAGIELLQATKNRSKSARLLGISWDEINGIMERAVKRGLAARERTVVTHLGIDEKSFLKGHNYATVLTDTEGKRVLEVAQNRDTEAVNKVFGALNKEQKKKVKAVSMDFWKAYINGVEEHIPAAQIVHDKFHIMKYMNEAVNKVRAGEHKWRQKQKDSTLTGTKYLWLKKLENFTDKDKKKWQELKLDQLEVGRAWNLKELLGGLWEIPGITEARKLFKAWYNAATHSKLEAVISVAKTLKNHFENIITWWKHHITNSFAEGINSVIQEIKTVARGFRNFENYRVAILFFCGKLALHPQKSQ